MDTDKIKNVVASLTVKDILCAYSGKPGCACGCRGKYCTTPENKEQADADRGYPYDEDEVNAKQVARVLKLVKAHEARTGAGEPCEADFVDVDARHGLDVFWAAADDLDWVTYQAHPGRVYTVYLTEEARRANGVTEGWKM